MEFCRNYVHTKVLSSSSTLTYVLTCCQESQVVHGQSWMHSLPDPRQWWGHPSYSDEHFSTWCGWSTHQSVSSTTFDFLTRHAKIHSILKCNCSQLPSGDWWWQLDLHKVVDIWPNEVNRSVFSMSYSCMGMFCARYYMFCKVLQEIVFNCLNKTQVKHRYTNN